MPKISQSTLGAIMPACADPRSWVAALNPAMSAYEIGAPERQAAFLAQIAHESGELNRLEESLNYGAAGLMRTWPTRFPTAAKANAYARQPERVANAVYADRLGNGNEASGDGWRYRGRGLIQLTGKANYRDAGKALGLPLVQQPQLLLQPDVAARSAAWFWQSRGLNALADDRSDDDDDADFVAITKIINGGKHGLAERRAYWAKARAALGLA